MVFKRPEIQKDSLLALLPHHSKGAFADLQRHGCEAHGYLTNSRTLEARYVRDNVLRSREIHKDQQAYRAGHSTETTPRRAETLTEAQLEQDGFAIGTFLDIEEAFNYTFREVIGASMIAHGVPTAIVDRTCHIFGNRKLTTNKVHTTLCGTVDSGCP